MWYKIEFSCLYLEIFWFLVGPSLIFLGTEFFVEYDWPGVYSQNNPKRQVMEIEVLHPQHRVNLGTEQEYFV